MQHATPGIAWTDWLAESGDEPEATRLAALREYIAHTARAQVTYGTITAEWANKKLAILGVTERISTPREYVLKTSIVADVEMTIYAADRAAAQEGFKHRLGGRLNVTDAEAPYELKFVSGPEDDDDVPAVADDAPTTLGATLVKLREVIMLAHLAGPKVCDDGANEVLDFYGLAHLPQTREYVVTRPAAADMRTTVRAYDEASALRIAGWRWDDNQAGYTTVNIDPIDEATVTAADNVSV